MSRLKSLGALVVAPLTCLLVLACDTGQESSLTAPNPSFTVVGNPVVASASGSGQFVATGLGRIFSFTAQRQYDGTVQGRFQLNTHAGTSIRGSVTCITTVGTTAHIGGIVANGTGFVGWDAFFTVEDNSEGPQPPPDRITFVGLQDAGGATATDHCDGTPIAIGLVDITRGNIQVDQQGGP